MLRTLITLMPCFIFMNWAARLMVKKDKSGPQRILMATALLGAATFFADAVSIIPRIDYRDMALTTVFLQACVFSMFPLFIVYIRALEGKRTGKPLLAVMFLPPALMTGALLWVWARVGLDDMAGYMKAYDADRGIPAGFTGAPYRVLQITAKDIHGILIGVWTIVEWSVLLDTVIHNGLWPKRFKRFLQGRESGSQLFAICCAAILFFLGCILRMTLGRFVLMDRPLLQCILYIIISASTAVAFVIGFWYEGKGITLPAGSVSGTEKEGGKRRELAERLRRYMEEEEAFRRPELTLEEAASALSTNRTYLSEAVREATGRNFRGYVNNLRIEAAKKEMTEHPEDRLEDVAARTGFTSSSQLIKKFQEAAGESPRRWARKQN